MPSLCEAALTIAAVGGMARSPAVVYAWFRTFLIRRRFATYRFGWVELIANFEPHILLIVGYLLYRSIDPMGSPTPDQALVAALGAMLVLIGWAFQIWAFLSWPSLFAGHGVRDDQRLLTHGAYAVVRHPAYVGIFLVWLGVALAFSSAVVAAITVIYVIPAYVLYLREEEEMMRESFGDAYRDYCRRVPGLIPRPRSLMSGSA